MSSGSWSTGADFTSAGPCGGAAGYRVTTEKTWSGGDRHPAETPGADHPYSMDYVYIDRGKVKRSPGTSISLMTSCFGGPPSPPPYYWSPSDELALLGKLADKIRGHDFNAGIALGTGHQSAALIGDAAARLANGYRALKRGLGTRAIANALNGASGRSTGRGRALPSKDEHRDVELSRRWLEASYGWMPLLNDVHGAAQALAQHVHSTRSKKFRVSTGRTTAGSVDDSNVVGSSLRQYRHQLIYTVKPDGELPGEAHLLGLTNPAAIAWELVPWSFAIDWFLPIGTYLELQTIIPKLRGTFVRTITDRVSGTLRTVNPYWPTLNPAMYRSYSLRRTVAGGLTVPFPVFKNPLSKSWQRTANQIALLGSLRSNR